MRRGDLPGYNPDDPDAPSIDPNASPLFALSELHHIQTNPIDPSVMESPDYIYMGRRPQRPWEHRVAQRRVRAYEGLTDGLLNVFEQRELLLTYEQIATAAQRRRWGGLPPMTADEDFTAGQRGFMWKDIFDKVGLGDRWMKINGVAYETARTEHSYRQASNI